jgi:hypothetical protein
MDDQNHTGLLRLQTAELTARTPFCPEDQVIAEYYDAELSGIERTQLESHLNVCRYCLARIGMLEHLHESDTDKRIPEVVLSTAKHMTHNTPPARRLKTAPSWAVAAVLILALFINFNPNNKLAEPGVTSYTVFSTEGNNTQLRSINRNTIHLDVLSPAPGADIRPGALIQWSEAPGSLHYDIFILSNTGDVLWTERLEGTDWVLSESLQLAMGSKYYFHVEAQLPDGRSLSSRHVIFQLSGQQ